MASTLQYRISQASRLIFAATAITTSLCAGSAHGAFHLWQIKELFTNVDGTQEFIEFSTTSSGQNFLGNQTVRVSDQAGTTTRDFLIPSNLNTATSTANRTFLIATSTINSVNGVTPDFATLPAGFLFGAGGKISLVGATQGAVSYSALPVDNVHAESFPGPVTIVNNATNFAGASAQVVPEPTTWTLLGAGGIGCCLLLRRIRSQAVREE